MGMLLLSVPTNGYVAGFFGLSHLNSAVGLI